MLAKLTTEYGSKLQAVGLAFDKEDAKGVPNYIKTIGTNFPVGSAETQAVNGFLGISVMDYSRMRVPQVVVLDKKGVIRGQTGFERQRTGECRSQFADAAEHPGQKNRQRNR